MNTPKIVPRPKPSMPKTAFSTDPFIVREGKSDPAPERAWEESLTEVLSNEWVNAEYKHLIVKASPKALTASCGTSGTRVGGRTGNPWAA